MASFVIEGGTKLKGEICEAEDLSTSFWYSDSGIYPSSGSTQCLEHQKPNAPSLHDSSGSLLATGMLTLGKSSSTMVKSPVLLEFLILVYCILKVPMISFALFCL